jgi:arylsulfatase A-like enzyme
MIEKCTMYEEVFKVPWLMRVPEMGRKQRKVKSRVSHIDLVPTILQLMDRVVPENLPGKSLVPLIKGEKLAMKTVFLPNGHQARM